MLSCLAVCWPTRSFALLPPRQRRLVYAPTLLILTKASARSTVHRPANLDYIGIKRFDAAGKVLGEQRFLGLYTSLAYNMRPQEIPLLRRKVGRVLERASLSPVSHSGKVLRHMLDTFPRDDLFQISEDELYDIAIGILHLQERQRLMLFARELQAVRTAAYCFIGGIADAGETGFAGVAGASL